MAAYEWLLWTHLVGFFGFLIAHGGSSIAVFSVRRTRDPARLGALLDLSRLSVKVSYGFIILVLASGVTLGLLGGYWGSLWIWTAIVVAFVMMGGVERKMNSSQFRGGEATAVMGGIELDLRGAKAASDTVVIHVLAWWGGIEIRVPKDWMVTSEVLPIMAGYEDQTKLENGTKTHLVVKGLVVMGGIEVKN